MVDTDLSPLMRQYRDIKRGYPDAILLFRVGDFYEMFYEDAVEASGMLAITLTSRDKQSEQPVPLCGVPYHAASGYIAKLPANSRVVRWLATHQQDYLGEFQKIAEIDTLGPVAEPPAA